MSQCTLFFIKAGLRTRTKVRVHIEKRAGANAALKASPTKRSRRDSGAMLLAVLFMVAIMVITALAVAPAFIQQAKRDREEEMIHRGTEYARAVKKYYKKFGRYPANLEQLEKTNNIRFLRRKFKDPLVKDGQWKLLHYGDIATLAGAQGLGPNARLQGPGGGPLGSTPGQNIGPGAGSSPFGGGQSASTAAAGAQLSQQQQAVFMANQAAAAAQATGSSPFASSGTQSSQDSSAAGPSSGVGGGQSPTQPGQTGSNNTIFGNTGVGGQTFGGGAIVGVASKSKDPTIRIYNKKKTYDEWQFIYSPMLDRQNVLLRGPYNGQSMIMAGQYGTAPGQNPQGQQPGTQNPQPNQPPNQQLLPGNPFPPDQRQAQPQ